MKITYEQFEHSYLHRPEKWGYTKSGSWVYRYDPPFGVEIEMTKEDYKKSMQLRETCLANKQKQWELKILKIMEND
jgi:hypothetical protein